MGLTLYKRGKIWHVRGTVAGQRIRESTGLGNRAQADAYRIKLQTEALERHAYGRQVRLTFAQAALPYIEAGGETRFLGPILQHFGPDTLLADVDNDAVNACARALYPDAAPATINRQVITPISAIINMAADDGKCAPRRLRRRKAAAPRKRWLTPAEAEALITAAAPGTAAQIAFLLGTGCRTGEMLALDRADLDLEAQEAFIAQTKNGHARRVLVPTRAKRMLATLGLPELGRVFRTPKGKAYVIRQNGGGQIAEAFGQARTAAGLGAAVTPHVCRHTWATWFWAHNKDLVQLMARGGWETAGIAMDYTKLAPAGLGAELFEHGWDLRVDTNLTQAIPAPTPNQLKAI
ncbi:MAG: site-specific integrase [Pseudomonadota bacterium]